MDINGLIQNLISDQGSSLIETLTSQLGMDASLAERFLPAGFEKIGDVLGSGEIDIASLLGGGGVQSLLDKADVGGLASQLGMEASQAKDGLGAIAPAMLEGLQGSGAESLLGALTGGGDGGGGGLAGIAGKLGGLFKS